MRRFFISLSEGFRIAMSAIWLNKVRAILTTTCIVIGIVSVTTMKTVTDGIDQAFEDSMSMIGSNVVYIEKWPWGFGGEYRWWEYRNRREIQLAYLEPLQRLAPSTSNVAATAFRTSPARYGERAVENPLIIGATAGYFQTTNADLADGRVFTEAEVQTSAPVAVMGATVYQALFQDEDPVGKIVRIGGQRFTIIGIIEEQGSFLGMEDMDNVIIIPISSFGNIFSLRFGVRLLAQFPDAETAIDGEYEVIGAMRQIRGLDPMEDNDFAINKAALFEEQLGGVKMAIYGIGIFLTGLALLVGGIGVMNIMFVSVRERTREIGIRKAVGAKSWEILLQFLTEAVIICMLGGIIGVLLSMGITQLINQFFVAYMDWTTVVQAILICTFIGLLFGYLPSSRAAKANPIESLRYE
ncbi:putative ABC transport system permease protein [Cyclonatronum proteinivorum]|uniref:Putative ABC transport system permease protein n=1 Tax=Cyclonatronum proteinivorum TaxID=1457365 RepID=A0A345UGX2_9BACT|nr:ABC transporter permease [Cyclonatronum proteinivorum]AXI99723.1 putative ABC transport system permease protein [Cyclonatronum proteinivorum]